MSALISYCKLDILPPPFSKKRSQIRSRQKTMERIQWHPKRNSSHGFSKMLHISLSLVNVLTPVLKYFWNLKYEEHYTQWYVSFSDNLSCQDNYLTAAIMCCSFASLVFSLKSKGRLAFAILQYFNQVSKWMECTFSPHFQKISRRKYEWMCNPLLLYNI